MRDEYSKKMNEVKASEQLKNRTIQLMQQELKQEEITRKKTRSLKPYMAVAAALLVMVLAGIVINTSLQRSQFSTQDTAAEELAGEMLHPAGTASQMRETEIEEYDAAFHTKLAEVAKLGKQKVDTVTARISYTTDFISDQGNVILEADGYKLVATTKAQVSESETAGEKPKKVSKTDVYMESAKQREYTASFVIDQMSYQLTGTDIKQSEFEEAVKELIVILE